MRISPQRESHELTIPLIYPVTIWSLNHVNAEIVDNGFEALKVCSSAADTMTAGREITKEVAVLNHPTRTPDTRRSQDYG